MLQSALAPTPVGARSSLVARPPTAVVAGRRAVVRVNSRPQQQHAQQKQAGGR
jgi:hypothetical protein